MNTGPMTILDKSTFQAFNKDEVFQFNRHFFHSLPPILLNEILADLERSDYSVTSNHSIVKALSKRFIGSGPPVIESYGTMSLSELNGSIIPMTGQIVPQGATAVPTDGGYGMFIGLTPHNHAIMRWANGKFTEEDHATAKKWRMGLELVETEILEDLFTDHYVIPRRCFNLEGVKNESERLLMTASLQVPLLEWFLDKLGVNQDLWTTLTDRLERSNKLLPRFAPYSALCIKTMLCLLLSERNNVIKKRKTNLIDIQYLYYLPFCYIFVSDDDAHRKLAPLLMRENQSFVSGAELRKSLTEQKTVWDSMEDKKRKRLKYVLGDYPLPLKGSVVSKLWATYMKPWRGVTSYLPPSLPGDEILEGIGEAHQMFNAANIKVELPLQGAAG